jgi:hypothetical protein
MLSKSRILGVLALLVSAIALGSAKADSRQQVVVSATPARVDLSSPTPVLTQPQSPPTPTRTPTPSVAALLEAKADAGPVNVRAQPDPNADKLGTIQHGNEYPVLGKYYEWYQFQYDLSPNKRGWVFGQLVDIIGDASTIADLTTSPLPTVDTSILSITQTWQAVLQTPGGALTVTAQSRIIPAPSGDLPNAESTAGANSGAPNGAVLPTFTYPPDIIAQAPTQNANGDVTVTEAPVDLSSAVSNGVAPIVPILGLVALGILGLAISSLRR